MVAGMKVAGTNYLPQLLNWVDKDNLPQYLGGTSTATLLDDVGPWQDPAVVAQVRNQRQSSHICVAVFQHLAHLVKTAYEIIWLVCLIAGAFIGLDS